MFKKIAALILAVLMIASLAVVFTSCDEKTPDPDVVDDGGNTGDTTDETALAECGVVNTVAAEVAEGTAIEDLKLGFILVGDESEGYTEAHMVGIREAAEALGIDEETQIIRKKKVEETEDCYNAAKDLVAAGCQIVVSNSYGLS